MGLYEEQVLPRIIDLALSGRVFDAARRRVAAGLDGEVLEVGFGSGRNVPHYPPSVHRVRAVDPAPLGRRLAARRVAQSPVEVAYLDLEANSYPLASGSVDHVLVTWTLCTIPEVAEALFEMRRVLRPGGRLHFVEHGRSPDPRVRRWQDRLTPIQRRVAGGCHLNRPVDEIVEAAGFEVERLETHYLPGPKPYTFTFEGVATRS